jgi:hypothetical protein
LGCEGTISVRLDITKEKMMKPFYTIYIFKDGTQEEKQGIALDFPCHPAYIQYVVEYIQTEDGVEITNLYNPNDI